MPRTAHDTTAPVEPADTNAPPAPRPTSSQPTTRLEAAHAAAAAPRSAIGTASSACTTAISPAASCRRSSRLT